MKIELDKSSLSDFEQKIFQRKGYHFIQDILSLSHSDLVTICGNIVIKNSIVKKLQNDLNVLGIVIEKPFCSSLKSSVLDNKMTILTRSNCPLDIPLDEAVHSTDNDIKSNADNITFAALVQSTVERFPHPTVLSSQLGVSQLGVSEVIGDNVNIDCYGHPIFSNSSVLEMDSFIEKPNPLISNFDDTNIVEGDGVLSKIISRRIFTLSEAVDVLLRGGIPLGEVTEIAGVPGIGKTQFALQIACNSTFGENGIEFRSVILDCEGSIHVGRLHEIAEAMCNFLRVLDDLPPLIYDSNYYDFIDGIMKQLNSGELDTDSDYCKELYESSSWSPRSVLNNIDIVRITSIYKLLATLEYLVQTTTNSNNSNSSSSVSGVDKGRKPITCVVIDSIAFHLRYAHTNAQQRQLVYTIRGLLEQLAQAGIAVICLNQVTTKLLDEGGFTTVPALGKTWGDLCNNRILLSWHNGVRQVSVSKSSWYMRPALDEDDNSTTHKELESYSNVFEIELNTNSQAFYMIDVCGVRDVGHNCSTYSPIHILEWIREMKNKRIKTHESH